MNPTLDPGSGSFDFDERAVGTADRYRLSPRRECLQFVVAVRCTSRPSASCTWRFSASSFSTCTGPAETLPPSCRSSCHYHWPRRRPVMPLPTLSLLRWRWRTAGCCWPRKGTRASCRPYQTVGSSLGAAVAFQLFFVVLSQMIDE